METEKGRDGRKRNPSKNRKEKENKNQVTQRHRCIICM